MSSTKSEFSDRPMPDWSFLLPVGNDKSKKWHDSVTLDERKQAMGSILSSIMKKGDMNVFKYYHRKIDGQIYMAQIDEGYIHDIANSQSEYYKKIKEKTQEIANWDLDQEETIKSFGLNMMQFIEENDIGSGDFTEGPIDFGPNVPCGRDVDDPFKSRLMNLKHRRNAKMARKERHVANVTVTEDQGYNIEEVLQNLEVSEASSKKSKRKKKKKEKKQSDSKNSDRQDKEQNSAQDQEDPNPDPAYDYKEPIINKNGLEHSSGPECSTCFEPRIRSYLLLSCGHATFCEKCATHFCDSEDKRCPTCRATITGKVRVFS